MQVISKLVALDIRGTRITVTCAEVLCKDDGTEMVVSTPWIGAVIIGENNTDRLLSISEHCSPSDIARIKALLSVV